MIMFNKIRTQMFKSFHPLTFLKNGIAHEQTAYKPPSEINLVKLMGTINHDVIRLKNDTIKFYLKTVNENNSYCVHKVSIANRKLLGMVQNKLAENQRIYVGGRMKTEAIQIGNQWQQNVEILANELFLLEAAPKATNDSFALIDDQSSRIDENSIEMMGFIATELRIDKNLSAFSLRTHFVTRKGEPGEELSRDLHRVLVHKNPDLMKIAANLRKYDRVYIKGFINYTTKRYNDDKEYVNGHVHPVNLVKLKKIVTDN